MKRKTASRRLTSALTSLRIWCRNHRHQKVKWQQKKLAQKLQGHYAYYGITGNAQAHVSEEPDAVNPHVRICGGLGGRPPRSTRLPAVWNYEHIFSDPAVNACVA